MLTDAIWNIAVFVKQKVIMMDGLDDFSEDLIDAAKLILDSKMIWPWIMKWIS